MSLFLQPLPEKTELEAWLVEEMDRCISEAWLSGSEDTFAQLLHLILSENVSVDYQVHTLSQFIVIMQYVMYVVTIMCDFICACCLVETHH
jgi:hypothetical protein